MAQRIVGVTGEISAGKSYVSKRFIELGKEKGIQVHWIDMDKIGHAVLDENDSVKEKIVNEFGGGVKDNEGSISRKALGNIVFNDSKKLAKLNEIMREPIVQRAKEAAESKEGLVLLDGALLAEANITHLCKNEVVLVGTDKESQRKRLEERGLGTAQIQRRLESQYTFVEKKRMLEAIIEHDGIGELWVIETPNDERTRKVFDELARFE